ncbi:MAG: hypothetical protein Q4G33_05785 [bacterium]|nr:hypothetical protein [bacterium]
MKKIISFITVMSLWLSAAAVYAEGQHEPISGLSYAVEEFEDGDGMPYAPFVDDTAQLSEMEYFFYGYGGDYGYRDIDKRYMPEQKKELYNMLLKACQGFIGCYGDFTVSGDAAPMAKLMIEELGLNRYDASDVFFSFCHDHPEFYWLKSLFSVGYSGDTAKVILLSLEKEFSQGSERERMDKEIDATVSEWVEEINRTDFCCNYEKAKYIHDKILDATYYEYTPQGTASDAGTAHSISGVFDNDEATGSVCEGYAKAFQLIGNAFGIDSVFAASTSHAWNVVRMDDGYYYGVDATWDDTSTDSYRYFMKGSTSFAPRHTPLTDTGHGSSFLYSLPVMGEDDYIHTEHYIEKPSITAERKGSDVTVRAENIPSKAKLYAASYDESGRMKKINCIELKEGETTLYADGKIYLFAWDRGYSPLAGKIILE